MTTIAETLIGTRLRHHANVIIAKSYLTGMQGPYTHDLFKIRDEAEMIVACADANFNWPAFPKFEDSI